MRAGGCIDPHFGGAVRFMIFSCTLNYLWLLLLLEPLIFLLILLVDSVAANCVDSVVQSPRNARGEIILHMCDKCSMFVWSSHRACVKNVITKVNLYL